MKKTLLTLMLCMGAFIATINTSLAQSAQIRSMTTTHNAVMNDITGIKIGVEFDVSGMNNATGTCAAYFHFGNGAIVKDFNKSYYAINGQVSTSEKFTPIYDNSYYKSLELFIPYSELHMNPGTYELYYIINVFNQYGKAMAVSDPVRFEITAN